MSVQLPTEDDLIKLSRRGMVCYAVRCAMRVVHLTKCYADLYKKTMACIEVATRFCLATTATQAANIADKAAKVGNTAKGAAATYAADAAADTAYSAYTLAAASAAAYAASYAAETTYAAAYATAYGFVRSADADDACDTYAHAANTRAGKAASAEAAAVVAICDRKVVVNAGYATIADYQKLRKLTGRQARELGDPIDPGEDGPLGPLWPESAEEPTTWKETEPDETPILKVYFDESSGITEDEELLVLTYFNLLYQQQGQPGLIIVDDKRHVYEGVPYVTG